jgi:hypothetical protein
MATRKKRGLPVQLEKVRQRFEAWRRNRTVRTPIHDYVDGKIETHIDNSTSRFYSRHARSDFEGEDWIAGIEIWRYPNAGKR